MAETHLSAVVNDRRSGQHELHHGRQPQAPDVSASCNQKAVHVVVVEEAGQQQLPTGIGQMAFEMAGEGGNGHLATGESCSQQLTQHEIQATIKPPPVTAHQLGRMGDLPEANTLGCRFPGGIAELGPETMAEAMGVIEAKASAALSQPMAGGSNQMLAYLGLLSIEFRLVGLVEKAAVPKLTGNSSKKDLSSLWTV